MDDNVDLDTLKDYLTKLKRLKEYNEYLQIEIRIN